MIKSKYIILDDGIGTPIVFSPLVQHYKEAGGRPVVSAGFCDVHVKPDGDNQKIEWFVWGESISLRKKSRPEDAELINKFLRYDC